MNILRQQKWPANHVNHVGPTSFANFKVEYLKNGTR